jgi:ABC-type sugar transport system permease subunit
VSIVVSTLWFRVGFCMVIYLAALQSIPREYSEAASVDGARPGQQFRWITLPLLRTATVVLALYGVIESFQVFDIVYVLTRGGPGDSTTVLGIYAYDQAFETRRRGYGATIGVILFGLLTLVLLAQWRLTRNRRMED